MKKTKDELIESASHIPAHASGDESVGMAAGIPLAALLTVRMEAEQDIDALVPVEKRGMMRNNHENHFRYMASAAETFDPVTFVNTVVWVLKTYRSHGFAVGYWHRMLPHCMDLVREKMPGEAGRVLPCYQWILDNLPSLAALSEPDADEEDIVHG